ncbi:MAG: hypothetical protein R3E13_04620 [Alphaproteobacteria bacterium]
MVGSKSILTVTTLAFALMFGGGVYVLTHMNQLAKPMAERIASDALGVRVSIGAMVISLPEKRVDVHNIKIGNPPGFSKPHALTIESARVGLKSVAEKLIDFEDVQVSGTDVFLEVKPGGTNLHALRNGIKGSEAREAADEVMKVILRNFTLGNTVIHPSVTLVSDQDMKPIEIAPITLKNVGVKENGVLAREAVAQIMAPLLKTFSRAAGDAGYYQGLSGDVLKDMGMGQFDQIKSQVQDEVDKIGEGLKSLFE